MIPRALINALLTDPKVKVRAVGAVPRLFEKFINADADRTDKLRFNAGEIQPVDITIELSE